MPKKFLETFVLFSLLFASSFVSTASAQQTAEQACGRDPILIAQDNSRKWRSCEVIASAAMNARRIIDIQNASDHTSHPVTQASRDSMREQLDEFLRRYAQEGCAADCGPPDASGACPSQEINWGEVDQRREVYQACLREWQRRKDNDQRTENQPAPSPSNSPGSNENPGQHGGNGASGSYGSGPYYGPGTQGGSPVPNPNPSNTPDERRCWDVYVNGERTGGGCED